LSSEEELRRAILEVRLLEGTAESLQTRLSLLEAARTEFQMSEAALTGLSEHREEPVLVPIGGGSYIKARLEDREKVIVGVGAGVALEKSFDEAKQIAGSQLGELEKARGTLQQQLAQVLNGLEAARGKIRELSQREK